MSKRKLKKLMLLNKVHAEAKYDQNGMVVGYKLYMDKYE